MAILQAFGSNLDFVELVVGVANMLLYVGALGGLVYLADRLGMSWKIRDE